MLTFWVCGWSTNGIIQTHFVPAAHDHGMPSTTAAGLLAVVGIFDIIGTVGSGWLTDRVDPRLLLVAYYGGRGLSLLALDAVLAPGIAPGMWVFIVFYGLDWVATVPPTVALCRIHFGLADSGVVFGWVFAAHMVGAGVGASVAGWVRTSQGDYHWAWVVAAALCFASVAITLSIPKVREGVPARRTGPASPNDRGHPRPTRRAARCRGQHRPIGQSGPTVRSTESRDRPGADFDLLRRSCRHSGRWSHATAAAGSFDRLVDLDPRPLGHLRPTGHVRYGPRPPT